MTDSRSDARTEILARVRSSLGLRDGQDGTGAVEVPRQYRSTGSLDTGALVDLLVDRLEDYDATVERTGGTPGEIAATVRVFLGKAGENSAESRIVVPTSMDHAWVDAVEAEVLDDSADSPVDLDTLDSVDAVVTASAVAVADTGTIMLVGPESGRRATTLVPDHHIVVVKVEDIVEIVPEAITKLTADGLNELPVTMVSGPSATVDIELIRVQGVHGPRTLDVIIAG
ncbi:LUD domain-containing protein [Corynebacterium glyciniphilum]|uniref:LutC/YkgG family protein n=1 Tax=Corynebacterium glyciniphilum TaxID=1404244 RepID=UPI00265119AF|nr:LUD domain-containing protein [Corynebacterium glyciniphilum]MDN5684596.1 LUD domain-containing protein [Corynebacterium glyciniphilum]